jgi:hypothetical protein
VGQRGMKSNLRLTWLSPFLFSFQPFKRRAYAPVFWGLMIFIASSIPLAFSGQFNLIFSRPLIVGLVGNTYILIVAYFVFVIYRHIFPAVRFAVAPTEFRSQRIIKKSAMRCVNNDRIFFWIFALTITVTFFWSLYAFMKF